ncbi:uncharacterized protein Fhos isoform X2 [Venturia canescens]|uniref:uncharacterized protein Fhos isoform X2 n=1 Tax=Venturia canescens TaxID=32260 RepID=UPI001C9C7CA2|nr:uncharacterized protein LOC122412658 isoform X2 [Venturia canescens]
MTSYRSYSDTGTYKGRSSNGLGGSFARSSTGTTLPNYRSTYTSAGSSRVPAKDRTTPGYSSLDKRDRDKSDDKPVYKYSAGGKELEKSRLNCGRTSAEDLSSKSSLSDSRASVLDRYSYSSNRSNSDRPSSVLEKYSNRAASREKPRESDVSSRYVTSTYPGPGLRGNYGNDGRIEKKERIDHPPISYRGLRSNSGRSSREPSPEVSNSKPQFRMYSKTPTYGRSSNAAGASDASGVSSITSRLMNQSSRLSSPRTPSLPSATNSEKIRTPVNKSAGSIIPKTVEKLGKSVESATEPASETSQKDTKAAPKRVELTEATTSQTKELHEGRSEEGDEEGGSEKQEAAANATITLTMISRCTSPTPPSGSSFVSRRRADVARLFQREITRSVKRPEMRDSEMQSDRMDDTARYSRFGSSASRVSSPWSSYLDKFSSAGTSTRNYGNSSNSNSSARINSSFGYSRQNESPGTGRLEIPRERPSPSPPRTGLNNREFRSSLTPEVQATPQATLHKSPSRSAGERETSHDDSSASFHTVSRGESSSGCPRQSSSEIEIQNPSKAPNPARNEDTSQKRTSSISKLARASPKNDGKLSQSSSKSELSGSADNSLTTGSTSISTTGSSIPKSEDHHRNVDGQSENYTEKNARDVFRQRRENSQSCTNSSISSRREGSNRSESLSPSASKSISRVGSSKSVSRKMTRSEAPSSSSSSSSTAHTSDGVNSVSVPTGRTKSSSSLTSQPIKIKTASSSSVGGGSQNSCKNASSSSSSSLLGNASSSQLNKSNSGETRGKPPVPKTDTSGIMKIPNASGKYVNKDFRKSALNMENGDGSRSSKHADRKRLTREKCQRSVSASSQDSEMNSESNPLVASAGSSSGSSKSSRSPGKLRTNESRSDVSKKSGSETKSVSPSVSRLATCRNSKSRSGSPVRRKQEAPSSGTSSSSDSSSESSSSSSSSSENDEPREQSSKERSIGGSSNGSKRRRKRTMSSPRMERKMSVGSSRTSVLLSSADESSLAMDKPPRPPSSPRSRSERSSKTEDAKSFLMRALAPVASIFRGKQPDSGSEDWPENTDNCNDQLSDSSKRPPTISKSTSPSLSKSLSFTNPSPRDRSTSGDRLRNTTIKRESSGERPWWMDPNSDNVPDGVERVGTCQDEISQETTISTVLPDDGKFRTKLWKHDSGERAWWLDANDNVPQDTVKNEYATSSPISRRSTSRCSTRSSDFRNRIKHQQSGERAWWLSEDPSDVPEGVEIFPAEPTSNSTSNDNSGSLAPSETLSRTLNGIRHIESGERAWWMDSNSNIPEGIVKITPDIDSNSNSDSSESFEKHEILSNDRISSYQRKSEISSSLSRFPLEFNAPSNSSLDRTINNEEPLGERASPEGVENPPDPPESHYETGRKSPYDNVPRKENRRSFRKRPTTLPLFIGSHKNIDDLLGEVSSPRHSPVLSRIRNNRPMEDYSEDSSECEEIDAAQVIIHDSTPKTPIIQRRSRDTERPQPDGYIPLDDTALQLYKDGDYGAYLDLEASINEQQEEFEGFQTNRKNSIVLRTQLSVRVHTIIEKLLNSEGRELRRALFSLKQTFQEDKDLVHEFVQNDGLACLIRVGNDADQNYQNYILRALGQVMLYVDGMNGVMEHGQTVQWLYTLIASRFRLVVKTALKLLLVFVEYIETNSLLLVRAVRSVDTSRGMIPWTNVMRLFKDYDAADTELLIYATTLVNKCLNGIPDQDTYYDQVDCLEDQGIEAIIQRYMSKQGTDLDLLGQFQIYEAVLHHEDGNDRGSPIKQLDDNIRKTLRNRKSLVDSHGRRKSRRHSTGTSPLSMSLGARLSPGLNHSHGLNSLNGTLNSSLPDDDDESSSSQSSQGLGEVQLNGSYKENKPGFPVDVGVTPALRRRRERAERQRSFIREQQEATANMRASIVNPDDQEAPFATNGMRFSNGSPYDRNTDSPCNKLSRANSRKDLTPIMNAANKLDSEEKKPWYGKSPDEGVECDEGNHTDEDEDRRVVIPIKREGTVKDLTQKLTAQNLIPSSPVEDKVSRIGDMSGLISKAKEGLAKSKSKADVLKSPTGDNLPKLTEVKKSENELHWEELVNKLNRPLALCDLDFTDLTSDDEIDVLGPVNVTNGVPPPPPPMVATPASGFSRAPPPPPPGGRFPPPFPNGVPPLFGVNLKSTRTGNSPENSSTIPKNSITSTSTNQTNGPTGITKKSKKTVKLFWKEVRDDPIILTRLDKNKMIWDELLPVPVDTQKLEHLFESRAKDLITKKQQEMNKNKEIIVLDHKRSNAINIGMTKLPPPRSIKTAILKMDATIMNREGIEKLLTMLPTEEERSRIQEAQAANPDLPLGSAEQFLLTLASISELPARLKLWAFKLDFENSEKEIADPLMDLKQGMETLRVNKTFRGILSTLLSIGIFLNGNEVKGFQLEYLAKVPEVKDTVHKHSLLHHLCHMVMEKFPDSTDLYSEIGAVTRASKIDFDELASNIGKLESECKASWDHLKLITKHDGSTMMKVKMSDFLSDCAERIIVLEIVHRRIINRFHKFILWLGIPLHRVQDTKPNEFSRIVSEFALEYRTTRERVIQQLEKKANHRERNKTRGKMITEVGKFRTKEDRADAELRQLLGSDISDVESLQGTLPWRRQRKDGRTALGPIIRDERSNGNVTDGDDELLESLVKTATKTPATRTTPRERKRTRHADRKSLRRTLKNGLSEEEKKHIAAHIKSY